nr:CYP706G29 protein [Isodon rubescens]
MDVLLLGALLLLPILLPSIFWYKNSSWSLGGKAPPLPPGPRGVPVLGYLPFVSSDMLQQFTDLSHEFGPIYKLRLGSKLAVVITSPTLIKQVVRDQDPIFSHRDVTAAGSAFSRDAKDLVFAPPDSRWRAIRKVLVSETQSGSGLNASYELRKEQLRKAIRDVYSRIGQSVELGELAFQTEFNLMMNLLWGGIDFGTESHRLGAEFKVLASKLSDLLAKPNVSDLFPLLAKLDLQGVKKQMLRVVDSIDGVLEDFISEHEKSSGDQVKEGRKDFVQILLELKEKEDSDLPRDQLKTLLANIILGGTETSSTTVEFAMTELLNNPEAMEKVQKELSEVVGMDNIVEEFHLPKLHYLNAVIKETLRLHPPVPFLIPRSPLHTSTLGGYTIPKGTRVLLNVWAVQRDPSIWDSPDEFKPDRFLQDGGNLDFKGNNFHFIPFGSGRRICPGLPLAERMVTYMLASFLHSFDWKLPNDEKLDMSVSIGIVLMKKNPSFAIPTPRLLDASLYV